MALVFPPISHLAAVAMVALVTVVAMEETAEDMGPIIIGVATTTITTTITVVGIKSMEVVAMDSKGDAEATMVEEITRSSSRAIALATMVRRVKSAANLVTLPTSASRGSTEALSRPSHKQMQQLQVHMG
jgi:hypothetical protein